MNSIMHFYARTCHFAYAPFRRYSSHRIKMSSRELKVGAIIGTLIYSIFILLPLLFLSKGDLQAAFMFSFIYPSIIIVLRACEREYQKEKIEEKMNRVDYSLYFSSQEVEKEL